MQTLKMQTVLEYIQTQGLENVNLKVEYLSETIFTTAQIFNELRFNYSTYQVPVSLIDTPTAGYFIQLWQEYVGNTKQQLFRALEALTADYDPVSNYDMKEQRADGVRLSKETDTTTPTGGTKVEQSLNRYGIDSGADGAPYDKSETQTTPLTGTKTETERSYANDKSMSFGNDTYSNFHSAEEHYVKRSGNIGVTLASDMVRSEYELRKLDLLRSYVKTFIDRYAYTIGGY